MVMIFSLQSFFGFQFCCYSLFPFAVKSDEASPQNQEGQKMPK